MYKYVYIYIYALRLEGLINVNEHLTGEIHKSEVLGNTLLGIKAYNMYQSLTKTHKTKQNSAIKELLAAFLLTIKMCIGFTADFIWLLFVRFTSQMFSWGDESLKDETCLSLTMYTFVFVSLSIYIYTFLVILAWAFQLIHMTYDIFLLGPLNQYVFRVSEPPRFKWCHMFAKASFEIFDKNVS